MISEREAVRPDIAGLWEHLELHLLQRKDIEEGYQSYYLLKEEELDEFYNRNLYEKMWNCGNNCLLTINKFSDNREFISGNRCERGAR